MIRRLLILLWLPTLAFAQQSYYGTTAIGISLSDGGDPSDLRNLPIKTGDTITAEKIRASIQVLFDTGRYRSIEVDATRSSDGTQLTFNVVRHIFFSTFQLLPEELLLDRSLSTLTRLPVGQRFSEEKLEEVVTQAKQALRDVGYFNVDIDPVVLVDTDPHLRKVELRVTTGPRAKIGEIVLEGGGQIYTDDKLRDDLHIKTGNSYSQSDVDKGVNAIRQRFLDDAYLNTKVEPTDEYDAQTNTVRLKVVIDPGQRTVVEIASTGQAEIDEKEIRALLPVYQEGALDEDLLREGQANIVEFLQQKGYFEPVVEPPKVVPAVEGGLTRITVSIEPGERHTVNSVRFVGNTVFTDKELKDQIKVRAKRVFGLNHGLYSGDLASRDVLTIQAMYKRDGYEAAFVEYRANDPGTHEIDVTFEIFENLRFNIERIDFVGNDSITEEQLREAIAIKEGDPYSPGGADDARTALTRLYYKEGFPDVRVEYTPDTNPETRNKTITYRIEEGPRYVIVQILVAGNTKTAEKVIKRTSGLKEYENFDPEKILEAQQKLYATGLFRHVEIVPLDREMTDRRTVLIQVEEAKHILIVPGVGVKEYAGPRALLDISHTNLFGLNQSLTFRFRVGVQEQQFQTTYRQPRLFNHDDLEGIGALTLGVVNQKTYRSSGVDLSVQARKRLSATKTFIVLAGYQTVDVREVKFSDVVFEAIRAAELTGVFQIARVGASFVRDTRDNPLNPKRGTYITNNLQVASRAWGSEVNFLSFFNQTTYQRPTGVGTLAMSSRVGWKVPYGQTPEVPITERYFAGGSMTLRGFGLDEAGPAGGGQLLTIGNVEYRVPIRSIGALGELGGAVFYDTGNVYLRPSDFSLRLFTHSVGPGLRFITPLGPVRFDVGFNLRPRFRINENGVPEKEKRTHVFFTLGHMF